MIEYIGILSQLDLSETEKEQAKLDMETMQKFIEKLNELDTTGVEPMSHIFPAENAFRLDEEEAYGDATSALKNAPTKKDGYFVVPKTIG